MALRDRGDVPRSRAGAPTAASAEIRDHRQLAGGIAHYFKQRAGRRSGLAESAYDQSREHPQIAEYFAHIRQQTDRAAVLTRELLRLPAPASAAAPGAIEPDC